MKKITTIAYYDIEELKKQGFRTERQIQAVHAIADMLETIRGIPEDFAFMAFMIKDADLLNHRPVEILSNLSDEQMVDMLADYCLARLKAKNTLPREAES